jgi:serine phosphatase RsbU (regulator of sigma subunit)
MPLGGPGRFVYQPQQVVLEEGDTVLLMSDGLPELRGAEGEFLDYNRIAALLSEVAGQTPEEVIACLLEGAADWCSGTAPDDDITLIVLKVK